MANDVDRLSDEAHAASKVALLTHGDGDHREAAQKHKAAFILAQQSGRPSLAQHHLQAAALHERHVDPTTREGKASIAFRASGKAKFGGAKDHEAAEGAHRDAAREHREAGDFRGAERHDSMAAEHYQMAQRSRGTPKTDG